MGRGHVEIVNERDFEPVPLERGWPSGAEARILSLDSETGALTAVVELAPGFRRGAGHLTADSDLYVLEGTLRVGGETLGRGAYQYRPPGATQEPWACDDGARVYLASRSGAPEFVPGAGGAPDGAIDIDTDRMPWTASRKDPGPPPGFFGKVLRSEPDTGAGVFLSASVPHLEYPHVEYHSCIEESYFLLGDIRMGTSGLMEKGSYFWRPPFITHGPFYSLRGKISLLYIDGPLVNHFVDDPARTAEENRAEYEAKGVKDA